MTTKKRFCPNPEECNGKCLELTDVIKDVNEELHEVYEFIVSWFEDDEDIQPIKNRLGDVIQTLKIVERFDV